MTLGESSMTKMELLSVKSTSDLLLLYGFFSLLLTVTVNSTTLEPMRTSEPTTAGQSTEPAPRNVENVSVVTQNTSSLTLKWDKVNNISTYQLLYDSDPKNINDATGETFIQHVVSDLTAGTEYSFTLFTEANGVNSSGLLFSAATAPENVNNVSVETQSVNSITLKWDKVNSISTYKLQYEENGETVTNNISNADAVVQHVVSDLTAGTEYSFTLFTEANGVNSSGLLFSAATAPENIERVSVETQSVNSITLKWDKVNSISTYKLQYEENGETVTNNISNADAVVQHVVSDLTAGTEYSFTLFTEANGVNSSGLLFSAATAPENVESVSVITQNTSSITLQWDKVSNISIYKLEYEENGETVTNNISNADDVVQHVVSDLTAGTKYSFILFTEANGVNSSGLLFSAATAPENVESVSVITQNTSSITLQWDKVNSISIYKLQYEENGETVINNINNADDVVQHVVSDLTAGTEYSFTLFTEANGVNSSGLLFSAATAPENVVKVEVEARNTSSLTLQWDKVNNISTYKLEYIENGVSFTKNISDTSVETFVQHVVPDLTAGTEYSFSLFTVLNEVSSSGFIFTEATAPENVESVSVETQNTSSITIKWDKVNNISTYKLQYDSVTKNISDNSGETFVQHVVSDLTAGTEYSFTLFTEANGVNSSGLLFSAATAPRNVESVSVETQSVNSITLKWDKVNSISTYKLQYEENGETVTNNISNADAVVQHVVSDLTAGTEYNFTLFTVLNDLISSGLLFSAATAPENVESVSVITQNTSSITLQWDKVSNISIYKLEYEENGETVTNNISNADDVVQHVVSDLTAGTKYSFILFTEANGVNSSGLLFSAATAPENVESVSVITQNTSSITLQWDKVNSISIYKLQYEENGETVINNINNADDVVQHVVSDLTAGTEYSFTLFTEANGVNSSGLLFSAATAPENVESVSVETQNTSSITIKWDKVNNISTYKLQYDSVTKNISDNSGETFVQHVVSDLTAGTEYSFTLFTEANGVNSSGLLFSAATAPRNVESVSVETQSVNSITLKWDKVNSISTYKLQYEENGETVTNNISNADAVVQHVVSDLTAGTEYSFTLFTEANGVNSSGLLFSAATAPDDVKDVSVITQNTSSITLQWDKVNNISTYKLQYDSDPNNISDTSEKTFVQHVVSDLTAGTEYNFTLFTVLNDLISSGLLFSAATAPENVESVSVITQNTSSITLQWDKVSNISIYKLEYEENGETVTNNISNADDVVQHVVSDLTAGTKYSFILFTEANGVNSSGLLFSAATAPENVESVSVITQNTSSITLQWDKVNSISIYKLQYEENGETVINNINNADDVVQHVVSDLTAGTEYSFTLFTEANGVNSSGLLFSAATAPENVVKVEVEARNTSSLTLQWDKVNNISTYKLEYIENGVSFTKNISDTSVETFVQHVVPDLTAGTEYSFSLFTVLNEVSSSGFIFTEATAPENVESVSVETQNTSSITIKWDKVNNISTYKLQYDSVTKNISDNSGETFVQHVVSDLTAGTEYSFTLFTEANGVNSSGLLFSAATVPLSVTSVRVSERLVDRVTLQWENPNKAWKHNLSINDTNASITQEETTTVSYFISNLKPGTMYEFSVITVFSGLNSSAYVDHTVTQIDCSAVSWSVTNSSIQGTVEGLFSKATASNGSEPLISPEGKNVTFSDLLPGATYEISLLYETSSAHYPQCSIEIPIIPPSLAPLCSYWGSGYSAQIKWDEPDGVWTTAELSISGKTFTLNPNENHLIVDGLQPAKTYKVSVISRLETKADPLISEPSIFFCSTDNRGVIGGSVVGVLLFAVLICVIVFLFLKKPDIIRRKKSFLSGSRSSDSKGKIVPVTKFPDHYHQLSLDENRGFSQEYESLAPAGTNQTQKAATLPENRGKNRFTNILPYDWSRVKLNTSNPNNTMDYINANYLPGYSSSKEYIACQGPLPNTVGDFWRMVWEQKVKRIVMVTNCVEGGRTKCEQYWPEDRSPGSHGELIVSKTSEERESNWVLREFKVKHMKDSEERTVNHFHFTAWPDHGVPQGTEVLIRFRGLVRKHIESEGSKAPTVVHCSAGVGRTGTLIALDVLLQQLQQEQAVGINSFVYKMRQHRSHMVQTESQYVFLHQCIMDSLQPPGCQEENVYENDDLIYVNATALRQLR
ncbi:receptor-type tyrosine-protein phosphatase eta isoform X9 [Xiphophorus couchianus]|uniref:receptor-type tyrosine-protein phosphatase eta isoform X9 n=1 Tax=Xiphophorus couchianus TaxID=32473 RepID=UPI001016306D|nr:receptor-type tyrosine-protein phosphatase H isoform X9 [Xiphophorus couchianus]